MKSIKKIGMALALSLLISPMCSYASDPVVKATGAWEAMKRGGLGVKNFFTRKKPQDTISEETGNLITRAFKASIAAVGSCCKTAYENKTASIVVGSAVVAGSSYYLYQNYEEIVAYALLMKLRLQEKFAAKQVIEEGAEEKVAEDKN